MFFIYKYMIKENFEAFPSIFPRRARIFADSQHAFLKIPRPRTSPRPILGVAKIGCKSF